MFWYCWSLRIVCHSGLPYKLSDIGGVNSELVCGIDCKMEGNGVDPEPITALGLTDGGGGAILSAAAAAREAAAAVLGSFLISGGVETDVVERVAEALLAMSSEASAFSKFPLISFTCTFVCQWSFSMNKPR